MTKRRINPTLLLEYYARSKSPTTAMTALRFVCEYGRACDETKSVLRIEDYGKHVGCSQAQAFRRQQAFKTCSPNQDVLSVWKIVRPLLDQSPFKDQAPAAQALFAATIKITWTVP